MSPVGGPRHFAGPGLGTIIAWKCPGCGADNSGLLEAGCQLCGSGRPGTHVGQAPPAAAEGPAIGETHTKVMSFEDWYGTYFLGREIPEVWVFNAVRAAFFAGLGMSRIMGTHSEAAEPKTLPGLVALPFPVEGKVARTLIAALHAFIDTLFMEATDEIDSGEWCSVEEAKALIAQLEAHTNG